MRLDEWLTISWLKRNEIKKKYGIRPSRATKVVQIAPGVDTVEDDGIAENDLSPIKDLTIEQVLGAIEGKEIPPPEKKAESVEPKEVGGEIKKVVGGKKRGRPKKK